MINKAIWLNTINDRTMMANPGNKDSGLQTQHRSIIGRATI